MALDRHVAVRRASREKLLRGVARRLDSRQSADVRQQIGVELHRALILVTVESRRDPKLHDGVDLLENRYSCLSGSEDCEQRDPRRTAAGS